MFGLFESKTTIQLVKEYAQENPWIVVGGLVAVLFCIILVALWLRGGYNKYPNADMSGKTVLITGANTGIGLETAKELASMGAKVILGCRDTNKAKAAVNAVIDHARTNGRNTKEGQKDSIPGDEIAVSMELDLSSYNQVRRFARQYKDEIGKLDVLVLNAGVMRLFGCERLEAPMHPGHELQFATNHLGHYLLTVLLYPLLSAAKNGRVVAVSSAAAEFYARSGRRIRFEDPHWTEGFDSTSAYGQSKMANAVFARELAIRGRHKGVTAASLHPGAVATELGRHSVWWFAPIFNFFRAFAFKTAVQGAQTSIQLAVCPELNDPSSDLNGQFFADCAKKDLSWADDFKDDAVGKKLMRLSAQQVNLTADEARESELPGAEEDQSKARGDFFELEKTMDAFVKEKKGDGKKKQ